MMVLLILLLGEAQAFPRRAPAPKPEAVRWQAGRLDDVLIVKLAENAGLRWDSDHVTGPGDLRSLNALLVDAAPRFSRDPALMRADREVYDPQHRLADLTLYLRVEAPDAAARGTALLALPQIEGAWLAFAPMPPPTDIPPETPDFTSYQTYALASPDGFGFGEAASWPGGTGDQVAVADLEYGWLDDHEDLDAVDEDYDWGWSSGYYAYHGTSVLGQLVGEDNGYGVTGMVPDAEMLLISPYNESRTYDVADAVEGASSVMDAGDVLLIEQQSYAFDNYCPVEYDSAVFDAIAAAVARGIVVVEPGGNGGQNLDASKWGGWFDRDTRDSGAILVGGGASPDSGYTARDWYPYGSSYGERVDVQGWYDGIVTATTGEYSGYFADLYYPGGDARQAYTQSFGGTSGASPLVTAAAAVAQSVAIALGGSPWDPMDLRAALVSTGTPQPDSSTPIGPQPDLRRLLRTYALR